MNQSRVNCFSYFCDESAYDTVTSLYNTTNNWMSNHVDMINYCYYCNHSQIEQFRNQTSRNDTCMYFWRHDVSYCPVTSGQPSPAIFTFWQNTYFDYRKSIDPFLNSLDPNRIADFLLLTYIRTSNNDHIGERGRNQIPYLCFDLDRNGYTIFGDAYDWVMSMFCYYF
jgi:hypothetical protein